jgi:hypothetical protein
MKKISSIFLRALGLIGVIGMILIALGLPLMLLWNWLMPTLFGLPIITFWQAVGLNFLSTILFKPYNIKSKS